uniref:Uncharacterized LOC114657285 n=1 Tax=Erpetoichthys calabaricus TaxID=27687 RepID=A0A8C4RN03_ERPCA
MQISNAQDIQKEMALMMSTYSKWGEDLMQVPISINVLGQLVKISASGDFALDKEKPLQYIKNHQSFHANVLQMYDQCMKAFSTAHNNMEQISLYCRHIPQDVKKVIQTLMQGQQKINEVVLPMQMNKIVQVSQECLSLSESIQKDFTLGNNILEELLEHCKITKMTSEDLRKRTDVDLVNANLRKTTAENKHYMAETYYRKMKNEVAELKDNFRSANWERNPIVMQYTEHDLQQSNVRYHQSVEDMRKCDKEHDDVQISIINLQAENNDCISTINNVTKGLDALGQVKEQWIKISKVFHIVTNLIKTLLNQHLTDFLDSCKSVTSIADYSDSEFVKDLIYGTAFQSVNAADLLQMFTETYVDVSGNYLLAEVGSLVAAMCLNPTDCRSTEVSTHLKVNCYKAKETIEALVIKNKEEFENGVQARVDQANENLKNVLTESNTAASESQPKNKAQADKD